MREDAFLSQAKELSGIFLQDYFNREGKNRNLPIVTDDFKISDCSHIVANYSVDLAYTPDRQYRVVVTRNGEDRETYVNIYKKVVNRRIYDDELEKLLYKEKDEDE